MTASVMKDHHTARCRLCRNELAGASLRIPALPPCNRFEKDHRTLETRDLAVVECQCCGLTQLCECPPISFTRPRVPWIRYSEPSAHLDDLLSKIGGLVRPQQLALGVGPFDQPLLDRLDRSGMRVGQLDLVSTETDGEGGFPYLETIQTRLRPGPVTKAASRFGSAHLVICRYLLEHSDDPVASLIGLSQLLAPGGHILIEVPDGSKFIRAFDYSFLWEEHVSYFVESTLRALAKPAGLEVVDFLRYEGALEDALLVLLRASGKTPAAQATKDEPDTPFAAYAAAFEQTRERYRSQLSRVTEKGGRIALVGVGHQAVMFFNALRLQEFVGYVVDDDPSKQDYYPPGFSVRIAPSAALAGREDVAMCLVAVNPRSEPQVREKLASLLIPSIEISSIYAGAGGSVLKGAGYGA
jgi:SAM-dependent methyltransferase